MHTFLALLICSCPFVLPTPRALGENPQGLVSQAVQVELAADRNDHSHWIYFDVDRKPSGAVEQWVAETGSGNLHRILSRKGARQSLDDQRSSMDRFVRDPEAQARQRKSGRHDDSQSEELLRLLPTAFSWTAVSTEGPSTLLHFAPNPGFKPPTWESRVFAALEGNMRINTAQHRIVSLQGRLIRPVRFCGGICGSLSSGGTFDVERRELAPSIWEIVETHVHIQGTALLFKNISQDEDETKSRFHRLPGDISLQQAETNLMQQNT